MAVKRHQTHYDVTAQNSTDAAFRAVENNLHKVNNAASRMGETFRAVVGATVAAGLTREMARAAIEAEKAGNRLTAVLRATGGAAGVSRKEIDALADSLADSTLFDDDAIRSAAAEMVKFGNIQGDVFKQGLRLSTDLAAFMGTDVPEAAQLIGKALQSPTEGITALERQFGKLTQAEEDNIKTLVAQNRAFEAQNAVLDILRKKIGGTAEQMNTGLTRAVGGVGKAWNELLETLGKEGTIFNRSLGGAEQLLKDIKGEFEGVRTPLSDLANDTLRWLGYLRFIPGVIGMVGQAARNTVLEKDKQRRTVGGRIRNPELEGIAGFEASLANTPVVPIVLGGRTTDTDAGGRAQREAEFRAQKAVELEEMAAQDSREAWQVYTDGRLKQEKDLKDGHAQMMRDWFDTIDREQEEAIERGRVYLEGLQAATEEADRFAGAIDNAFDRAVRGGSKAIDIVKNLIEELAMVELQKRVFNPASKGLSGILDNLFAGIAGGDGSSLAGAAVAGLPAYADGTDYVPRTGLALVHKGEKITPAGRNGGSPTFNFITNVDSRTDSGVVYQEVLRANRATEARILDSFRRGGAFARAAGTA